MAKNKTSFQAGQSGNPGGRPPKCRALTEILLAAGNKKCSDGQGNETARKHLLAEMIWQAATSGQVTFHATNREWGASRTFDFLAGDWFEVVKWIFAQVDGDFSMTIKAEESSGDAPATGAAERPIIYVPDNGRGDSDTQDPETDESKESGK